MLIKSEFDIQFMLPQPTAMVALLHLHPSLERHVRSGNVLVIEHLQNGAAPGYVSLWIGRRNIEGGPRSTQWEHNNYRVVAGPNYDTLGREMFVGFTAAMLLFLPQVSLPERKGVLGVLLLSIVLPPHTAKNPPTLSSPHGDEPPHTANRLPTKAFPPHTAKLLQAGELPPHTAKLSFTK